MSKANISGFPIEHAINSKIIRMIWDGNERFDNFREPDAYRRFLMKQTPRLFRIYERILLMMCRNANLAEARINQEKWRVHGSMKFLEFLQSGGVKNYFITGAVVEHDMNGIPAGTMYEEVAALGYQIGLDKTVSRLLGSSWNEKLPKEEIMRRICLEENINPDKILIVGDGRSEIAAGVSMGAVTISRLDRTAERARKIHRKLKTNIIIEKYNMSLISQLFI
ncbi:MAG: HAD family hydrolase [Victivallales bacterium]|nr:HAD family hydrolase [Victivallales bacterium]